MSTVYIEHCKAKYPSNKFLFAPSKKYPEYRWDDISQETNNVYDMVRNALAGYGLDNNNFGRKNWNPFGSIIKKGDKVVIKPNWVEDKNENRKGGTECLVTHASIIRAIIDYVYIALEETGEIIVGDSPMPDCNFEKLQKVMNYCSIWESCRNRGINVQIKDFRDDIVKGFANSVETVKDSKEVIVDLGEESFFSETEKNVGKYRNGIVDATKMNEFYHANGHHRYGVNKDVLNADVIINLPKPKTHRKAGFTGALKNYIGICARKISIPHNVMGNVKEGGDTYHGPKLIFETEQKIRDYQNKLQTKGNCLFAVFVKLCRIPFYIFRRVMHRFYYGTGNWYKNDTIWRSILDLNKIMIYSDKSGKMTLRPQRKFFSLGDMIISGHKNGPLAPTPIDVGVILCSEDPLAFDLAVSRIMGFEYEMLPVLYKNNLIKKYVISRSALENVTVFSNDSRINNKTIKEMVLAPYGWFKPAEGWDLLSKYHR